MTTDTMYQDSDLERTYAGTIYATPSLALAAAYLGWCTAEGGNSDEEALAYAADEQIDENLRQAAAEGWEWPGNPSTMDFVSAAAATRDDLLERLR
jgi:hypothetical protein